MTKFECSDININKFNETFCNLNEFSILHLNIQSISKNFDNLTIFLNSIKTNFSIIGLSEIWLNSNLDAQFYNLPNYSFECSLRENSRYGGVGIYIHNSLNYKIINCIKISGTESLYLSINYKNNNYIIVLIYRKPNGNLSEFLASLEQSLITLHIDKNKCIFMGDLNIDLNCFNNDTNKYLSILNSNNLDQLIFVPTRVSQTASTIIDHLFTNISDYYINCGTINTCIADHLPIFLIFKNFRMDFTKNKKFIHKNLDNNLLIETVTNINWNEIYNFSEPNKAYNMFLEKFSSAFMQCHYNLFLNKNAKIKKPWMTIEIFNDIKIRDNLFYKWKKNKLNITLEQNYKNIRNKVNNNIKICKKTYFENKITSAFGNPNLIWKTIFEATNKKNISNLNSPKNLISNDILISNEKDIANEFNNYFVNIAKNLKSDLSPSSICNNITNKIIQNSIYLPPVNEIEIIKIINNLTNKKSTGLDSITIISIKLTKFIIAKPLTFIINLIFTSGFFPDCLKIAKIIPIFKSGDPRIVGNYRPISLLSNFEKIIEKCMYSRFMDFVLKNNILSDTQFGFRPKLNCEVALLEFTNDISSNLEKNNFSLAVFLDISKAFDTIDFVIMKSKLDKLGFRGIVLDLIINYLTNRKQYVEINKNKSFLCDIQYGVPQGSILGPLLFLLYINDLPNVLNHCKMIMYADDVVMWHSGGYVDCLIDTVNIEMNNIFDWYTQNKLIINLKKSNYIIFHGIKKNVPTNIKSINLGNNILDRVFVTKYLGLYIQDNLRWSIQIKKLSAKIAPHVGMISKIRHYFSQKVVLMYYYAFIHSHLSYAISIWGNTYTTALNPILILQKKSIRYLTFSNPISHSQPIFQLLNILPFHNLFQFSICIIMFKVKYNILLSKLMKDNILKSIHNHNTRQNLNTNYFIQGINNNYGKFKLSYLGPVIWNKLPNEIKSISSLAIFKKKAKLFFQNS